MSQAADQPVPGAGRGERLQPSRYDRLGIAAGRPEPRLSERLMAICRARLPNASRSASSPPAFAPFDVFDEDDKW